MDVTARISIWVKNLANMANVAGWVRRKEAKAKEGRAGWGPVCLLLACWLLTGSFSVISSQFPLCPNVCI